mgnify:CR=1 FL=1
MIQKRLILLFIVSVLLSEHAMAQRRNMAMPQPTVEQKAMYVTSTADLKSWMSFLTSPECRGRLTGDIGFAKATHYAADLFKAWGLEPGGDNGTYFQSFPHPYTEVKEGGFFTLYFPSGKQWIAKQYSYPDNYMVGGTSDTGFLEQKDLVYVGYGITAPELDYDSYSGIDVKGKIVVCERDVPYQGQDTKLQKAWTPYQYHSHKMKNAADHGAAGLLYISIAGNPNPGFNKGFVYACISDSVAKDIFSGTGKDYVTVKSNLDKTLKPNSFPINKKADIKAFTEFHPDGVGCNVIGILHGTDPTLAPEYLTIGAHLDHIGMQPYVCPGALDNASGSVIIMGAAKALATSGFKPKRTIVFVLFGGEETGLYGSDYLANHPIMPLNNAKAVINIDCLGDGYGFGAMIAPKYSTLFKYVEEADIKSCNRPFMKVPSRDVIVTRPRTDEANFFIKGVPTISPFAFGGTKVIPYHNPGDTMENINFDLVHDAVKWMATTLMDMSTVPEVKAAKE